MSANEQIWEGHSEEDIQECIEEAYENKSYDVSIWHDIDRAHENGVDLECSKGKEKILFAVKLSPKKSDINQLERFVKNPATRRIYVYGIKKPTKAFNIKLESYSPKTISLWGPKDLHGELIKKGSQKYLNVIIKSKPIITNLSKIWYLILSNQKVRIIHPNKQDYPDIYTLKYRSAMIRSMVQLMNSHYKRIIVNGAPSDLNGEEIVEDIMHDLVTVNERTEKLLETFTKLEERNPAIISLMWKKVHFLSDFELLKTPFDEKHKNELDKQIINWIIEGSTRKTSMYSQLVSLLEALERNILKLEKAINDVNDIYNNSHISKSK